MSLTLDHIIITVADLDAAMRDYDALGFTVMRGGVHANRATENALIVFEDGTYIELLARTGELPLPNLVDFSTVFAKGMGLAGYALRTDDLAAEKTRLEAQYIVVGDILPGERVRSDGKVVQWKLAQVNDSFAPFLIEDVTPRDWRIPTDPALTTHANAAVGLGGVELAVAEIKDIWHPTSERRARTLFKLLDDSREKLVAIPLIREAELDERFTPDRTHGVQFRQFIGASRLRGGDALAGLDAIDWDSLFGPETLRWLDVADFIRAFASPVAAVRDHAYNAFHEYEIDTQDIYDDDDVFFEAFPFLLRLLNSPDVEDKHRLLEVIRISQIDSRASQVSREALPIFLAYFDHPDSRIRNKIAWHLAAFGVSNLNTLEPILKDHIAHDTSPDVRGACVWTLQHLYSSFNRQGWNNLAQEHVDYFASLLRNSAQILTARVRACEVLVWQKDGQWVDEVYNFLLDMMNRDRDELFTLSPVSPPHIVSQVLQILRQHPALAFKWVRAQVNHPLTEIRQYVPTALVILAENSGSRLAAAKTLFRELLHDPAPEVRMSTLEVLRWRKYKTEFADTMQEMAISDPVPEVREYARHALGALALRPPDVD
jgi:hypothetical protein